MASLTFWICLLGLTRLACALDAVGANGSYLINNQTRGSLTLNGIFYVLSNSSTDTARMDPLTDAEACTRDAALMSRLGINNIYVDEIDATANHDDCFSIFNSADIYVTILLASNTLFTGEGGIDGAYKTERFEDLFRRIDAIKDYENLLGIDVGVIPDFVSLSDAARFRDVQNIFRAVIRDIKEYIQYHGPRPLLVGGSITRWLREDELLMTGVYEHVSCVIQNEEVSSAADFIGIQDIALLINPTADQIRAGTKALTDRLTEVNIPTWYSVYASPVRNEAMESTTSMIINGTLPDTSILYNSSYRFLSPYNALSGGTRFEWTNVRYTDQLIYQYPTPRVETYGITRLESDGSIQLTEQFDALSAIFANYNTKSWLSGPTVDGLGGSDRRECKPENIVNRTSSVQATVTLTVASEWVLPTRPPGLDAIITSGMQGTRGQMVDVLVTTVKHQIRDSKGEIMTDVVLSPSKSESRSTTARGTAGGTAPPSPSPVSGLTTGAKAGIGAGVGVAGAITLLAVALFLLQRRKSKAAAVKEKDMARASDASVNGYKAELATGPDVEAQPPVELPDKGVATPAEVTGTEYPGIGTKPIELPVHEPALEMPDPKTPK